MTPAPNPPALPVPDPASDPTPDLHSARLRAQVAQPDAAAIAAFYDAHPELFARRRLYTLTQTVIGAARERSGELGALLAASIARTGTPAAFLASLMDQGIATTSTQDVQPAEDMPNDLLAALQHVEGGAAFIVDMPAGPVLLQVASVEDQPVTLAQSSAAIAAFLVNQRVGQLLDQGQPTP